MTRTPAKTITEPQQSSGLLGSILLGLCLCLLALRATYTEAAIAQTFTVPGGVSDTLYSLILSGLLILALLTWRLWKLFQGTLVYRVAGLGTGLGIFAWAAAMSTVAATDKRLAITQVMMLLGPIAGAVLLVQVLDSTARIRVVLLTLAALGIVSTYQCSEQFFSSNQIMIDQYEEAPETLLDPFGIEPGTFQHFLFEHRLYSRGVRGFFTTSNSAASFGILASFAGVALLLGRTEKDKGLLSRLTSMPYRTIGVAVVVIGLLLTQSKGGILGAILAVILFALWILLRRWLGAHRGLALIGSLVLGTALVVVATLLIASYGQKHGRLPGGNSMWVRWQYWRASAQMYADASIMGVGPGNFAHNYPEYKPAGAPESVADPHCFPLSLLTQYGPVGLLGVLLMFLTPFLSCALGSTTETPPQASDETTSRRLTIGIMLAIVGTLLFIRTMLVPTSGAGDGALLLYEIIVLYIAPTGAFVIGFLLLASLRRDTPAPAGTDPGIVMAALGCGVLGVLVHNLIDFAIFEPAVWTALWMVIACMVATNRLQSGGRTDTIRGTGPMKTAAAILALAVVAAYGRYVLGPVAVTTAKVGEAHKAIATGRIERAHALLDEAFKADPLSAAPLNISGRLYLQEYEQTGARQPALVEKAASCFVRATEVNRADYKNYEKAAEAYALLGQDEEAYIWYVRATERYPGCGRIWLGLAQIAERSGRTDQALKYYQEAVKIEEAFRAQFRQMYPDRDVVSRLGQDKYDLAKRRIAELSI